MKPAQAAAVLRNVHSALMGDSDLIAGPAASLAFDAAKQAAGGRPTPQAPGLASSWVRRPVKGGVSIEAGNTVTLSGRSVYAGDIEAGALFGSNRSPQFHRAHRVPSWAWEAMENALRSARLDDILQRAVDDMVR